MPSSLSPSFWSSIKTWFLTWHVFSCNYRREKRNRWFLDLSLSLSWSSVLTEKTPCTSLTSLKYLGMLPNTGMPFKLFCSHYCSSAGEFIQLFFNSISFCALTIAPPLPKEKRGGRHKKYTIADHYSSIQFQTYNLVSGFSNFRMGQKGRAVNQGEFIYAMFDSQGELKQVGRI